MRSSSKIDASESANQLSGAPVGDPGAGGNTVDRSWNRWLLFGLLGIMLIVTAVFVATTLRLFVYPSTDQPTHVDGILEFNGSDESARTALAVSLAEKGYAPVILFSQGGQSADTSCPKVPKIAVVCFVDSPGNTRGEAEWAGRYAERHNWDSLLIVPGRSQATRARLLTQRCFSGRVVVVPISESRPALSDVVHQWGGLLSSLVVHRGC
jgi:hypothetical protein